VVRQEYAFWNNYYHSVNDYIQLKECEQHKTSGRNLKACLSELNSRDCIDLDVS